MRWLDKHRRLPAYTIFAAFALTSLWALGQAPAPNSAVNPKPTSVILEPQPSPTPEEMGDSLMAHRRYQAAIAAYRKGPKKSAVLWNKMGIAYQMMFNNEEATHCYKESLKLNPKSPHVLNNLGTVYDAYKQYHSAEHLYRKALKIDPQLAVAYKNLGTNLLAQRKYKKGWKAYQQALAVDPHIFDRSAGPQVQNPASLAERGAMNYYMAKGCMRAGQNDCAIDYLRKALDEGFTSTKKIANDGEFAALRELPAYKELLAEQKTP